jgi:tRNA pseudouridine32 synthase / 23S rRNA pseudouridine746 synthase
MIGKRLLQIFQTIISIYVVSGYLKLNQFLNRDNAIMNHAISDIARSREVSTSSYSVLYFDSDIIVVNKPPNEQTAPGFIDKFSLATNVAKIFGIERVDRMIVHRLDFATSGVVVFARNIASLKHLHTQFRRSNTIFKCYEAIVYGKPSGFEGTIDLPLSVDLERGMPYQKVNPIADKAKESLTEWNLLSQGKKFSHLLLKPKTGRQVSN